MIEQDAAEKLYPKVAIVTDSERNVLAEPKIVELVKEKQAKISRDIIGVPDVKQLEVNPRDYTFRVHGTKLALGPLSIRF